MARQSNLAVFDDYSREQEPVAAAPSRAEARASVESLVLGAALEDALAHLVQVYGPEYLDAFFSRRMRRNVEPFKAMAAVGADADTLRMRNQQAIDAEAVLRRIVEAVRIDPTPPE